MGEYADDAFDRDFDRYLDEMCGDVEQEDYNDTLGGVTYKTKKRKKQSCHKKQLHELDDAYINNIYKKYKNGDYGTGIGWYDLEEEYEIRQAKPKYKVGDDVMLPQIKITLKEISWGYKACTVIKRHAPFAGVTAVEYDLDVWNEDSQSNYIEENKFEFMFRACELNGVHV